MLQDVAAELSDDLVMRVLKGRRFAFRSCITPRLFRPGELTLQLGQLLYFRQKRRVINAKLGQLTDDVS